MACTHPFIALSQSSKSSSLWYTEYGNIIDFKTSPPSISDDKNLNYNSPARVSAIADENGELLFYTSGDTIWNRFDEPLPGGEGINFGRQGDTDGNPSTVIIPFPGDDKLYYVMIASDYREGFSPSPALHYSVVDMTGDAGRGAVVQSKVPLMNKTRSAFTVVRHADEKSFWVVTQQWNSDKFHCFLVSASGISNPKAFQTGVSCTGYATQMNSSPDGRWIVRTNNGLTDLFRFNSVTGSVNPELKILVEEGFTYGAAFSSDSELLYLGASPGEIHQFAVNAPGPDAILNSRILVGQTLFGQIFSDLQLAYDGRIYAAASAGPAFESLTYIQEPNVRGTACQYNFDGVRLPESNLNTLPVVIQGYYRDPTTLDIPAACLGDPTELNIKSLGYADSIRWDFGDGTSLGLSESAGKKVSHTYQQTGTFDIKVKKYIGLIGRELSGTAVVTPPTQPHLGADTVICSGQKLVLDAGDEGTSWVWSTGESTQTISVQSAGTYSVAVDNGVCIRHDEVIVSVTPSPDVSLGPDRVICDDSPVALTGPAGESYVYTWSTGSHSPSINVSESGNYNLTVKREKCISYDDVYLRFAPIPMPLLPSAAFKVDDRMKLHVEVDENSAHVWVWAFGDGTDTTTHSPSVTHSYEFEGSYTGNLAATNQWGCSAQQDFTVDVPTLLNIPNVFTPNGDGFNDYFEVKHNGRDNVNFIVVNRWGKVIFDSQSEGLRWDGVNAEPGTYFYQLRDRSKPAKGWVQLIR